MTLVTSRRIRRCPVCGADHAACGGPTDVTPVDQITRQEAINVADIAKYKVNVNGFDTVMKLTAEQAEGYEDAELVDAPTKEAPAKRTTARKAPTKARTAANKARGAANK